jgi:hypothetical protein
MLEKMAPSSPLRKPIQTSPLLPKDPFHNPASSSPQTKLTNPPSPLRNEVTSLAFSDMPSIVSFPPFASVATTDVPAYGFFFHGYDCFFHVKNLDPALN